MPPRSHTIRQLCLLAVLPTLAACRDGPPDGLARSMAPQRALASVAPADDNWDTYDADITVAISGGFLGSTRTLPARRTAYHSQRTMGADSAWHSSMTFTEFTAPAQRADHRIARITFDEGTGEKHVFDVTGHEQLLPPRDSLPASFKLPAGATWPAPSPHHAARKSKLSRDWADRLLINAQSRERGRSAIEGAFGKPETRQGRDYYRLTRGNRSLEIVRDPTTGLILENNIFDDARQRSHTTYSYVELTPGTYVATGTHTELTPNDGKGRFVIIDQSFTNVRFTRHGGL